MAKSAPQRQAAQRENLSYDAKARIQTGPGLPEWTWRTVSFGWNGPVQATQQVRPILISLGMERIPHDPAHRLHSRARRGVAERAPDRRPPLPRHDKGRRAPRHRRRLRVRHQRARGSPDDSMIETLRKRLLVVSDAFPTAADIPTVALTINDRKITIDADIHAATRTAVPLPGRLPAWSPVSVLVDGKPRHRCGATTATSGSS